MYKCIKTHSPQRERNNKVGGASKMVLVNEKSTITTMVDETTLAVEFSDQLFHEAQMDAIDAALFETEVDYDPSVKNS